MKLHVVSKSIQLSVWPGHREVSILCDTAVAVIILALSLFSFS